MKRRDALTPVDDGDAPTWVLFLVVVGVYALALLWIALLAR